AVRNHDLRLPVENALHPALRFIIGTGKRSLDDNAGYVLSHPKFGEFLREYFDQSEVKRILEAFAEWGREVVNRLNSRKLAPERTPLYLVQYLTQHFEDVTKGGPRKSRLFDHQR